ncbi:DUF6368 family protein [Streptomyces sp. NPDC050625]|uniref:DUF6368 family protein n=1 Tax=Streptomyces sp. NPDC050625 TaxID=3154629 RepID=UPI0034394BB8
MGLWLFGRPRRTREVVAGLLPWLESFCAPVLVRDDGEVDFWVEDPSALGPGADAEGTGAFFLADDEHIPAADEDCSAFPSPPVQGLVLAAGSSGPANHRMLGHLALALARRLDALIDFDGMLDAPVLPGLLVQVAYGADGGGRGVRQVGDAAFLDAWLRQPGFRLIM